MSRQTVLSNASDATVTADVKPGMKVGISSFSSWMLGVGAVIGSLAWLIHGTMLARAGTAATITAWVVAAAIYLPLCMILMELSSMFPEAGGPYYYKYYALKRLIPGKGELLGFLTGWLFWISLVVGLACIGNGLSNLIATNIWGSASASPIWFAPIVIVSLFVVTTGLNLLKVSQASQVSNLFTVIKLAMAVGFGMLVVWSGKGSLSHIFDATSAPGQGNFFANVSAVLVLAMDGYSFIELAGCTSSETKDASKSVPRAMLLTLLTVAILYISLSISVAAAGPYSLSANGSTLVVPGTTIAATCPGIALHLGGPLWGSIFTFGVVSSIIGCSFCALLAIARVSYSMAKTKLFPAQFAQVDEKSGVPRYALVFQFWCLCVIAVGANLVSRLGIFPDAYTFLAETFGFMYGFVAMLYGVCLVSLRYTDPQMERPYRVGKSGNLLAWLMAGFTVIVWSFASFCCVNWMHQVAGMIILLAGIPIYKHYRRKPA